QDGDQGRRVGPVAGAAHGPGSVLPADGGPPPAVPPLADPAGRTHLEQLAGATAALACDLRPQGPPMTRRTALTASLLSLAAAGWAMDPAPVPPTATTPAPAATAPAATGGPLIKPTVVPGEQSIAIDAGDLKQVAKARFFVSRDEGKTW